MNKLIRYALPLLIFTAAHAHAAIIGMFNETKQHLLSVYTRGKSVRLDVRSPEDFPKLIVSRQMPAEGGSVAKLIASLERGEVPVWMVAEWVSDPPDARPSVKLGLWVQSRSMTYVSAFSQEKIDVPHLSFAREPKGEDGVQSFDLRYLTDFLSPEERDAFRGGTLDLGLVVQWKKPGEWDTRTKIIPVSFEDLNAEREVYATCAAEL